MTREADGTGDAVPERLRTLPSRLVTQTAAHATRLVTRALGTVGAHRHHYAILSALDEFGPASQASLGRRCGIDRSDMAAAVAELADAGLAGRAPDPADRRRNVVTITARGRRRLTQLDALLADTQDDLLDALTAREREQLVQLLTKVLAGRPHAR